MPRRAIIKKRPIGVDPVYSNQLVQLLVNQVLSKGKKQLAYQLVYDALTQIEVQTGNNPIEILEEAIKNTTPTTVIKASRVRGSTQSAPKDIRPERGRALAIRWIVSFAKTRSNPGMAKKLANELLDASQKQGGAFRKREEVHRTAESNRQAA